MVPIIKVIFPFRSRPLIGGAGIAGKSASSRFGTFRESRERSKPFLFGTEKNRPGGFWGLTLEGDFLPYQNADIAGKEQEK